MTEICNLSYDKPCMSRSIHTLTLLLYKMLPRFGIVKR